MVILQRASVKCDWCSGLPAALSLYSCRSTRRITNCDITSNASISHQMSIDTVGRLWHPHDDSANRYHSGKRGIQFERDALFWMGCLVWICYRA